MYVQIRAIGKLKKNTPEFAIIADYVKKSRLPIEIKEYEEKKALAGSELKQAEAKLMLTDLPDNAFVVALDEHGQTLSSREFAAQLKKAKDSARPIVLMIGGADGHGTPVLKRADLQLSFGRMTLPHFLMRVVLAEQLYRAVTIWNNHPYHRD